MVREGRHAVASGPFHAASADQLAASQSGRAGHRFPGEAPRSEPRDVAELAGGRDPRCNVECVESNRSRPRRV
jgi:hypothetical protein